ncbi:hypothetical protein KUTeg_023518 [Tegillarca granosa]|uniref:Transposase n=1 Tax=Tegillarca granosa TaxID=220873 RepID=A0ABQ9E824_TEGGR|nr:hypothetical protein KUTeg_023518 [Tegillarca granosa]
MYNQVFARQDEDKNSPQVDRKTRTRRALYDVETKKVSIRRASIDHNLSYSYLYRRVSGETAVNATNGPDTVFSRQEKTEFAMYFSEMAKRGMGLRPGELLDLLQDIVRKENRKTPFTNDRPSYEWYKKFIDRNKDIVGLRKEILLEASRSQLTSERIDKWFSGFRDFLAEKDLLDKPERIWNADETGFQMGSKAGYVIGPSRETYQLKYHTCQDHQQNRA